MHSEESYAVKTREMPVGTLVSFTDQINVFNLCGCKTAIITHQEEFDSFDSRFNHEGCEIPEYHVLCGCGTKDCVMPYEVDKLKELSK